MSDKPSYEARGVSASKSEVHAAIADLDKGVFPGAFCKILPDLLLGDADFCTVMHADGAGTKSVLAYLHYRTFGDPSVFAGIAQDSLVMNLDDLLCVGADGPFLLSNTIGRNAKRVPGEVISALIHGYEAICAQLADFGVEVHGCGGETADVGDVVRTLIADSTLMTRMRRRDVVDAAQAQPGHVLVGLASFGQASYERRYNSGIGSNGLTQARHDVLGGNVKAAFPESFAPEISDVAYTGSADLNTPLEDTPLTLLEALLSPTRTYAPVLAPLLRDIRRSAAKPISAIFHITGGGQLKPLGFGRGVRYVKDNLFPLPPLFRSLQTTQGLSLEEMARVYNLGHRLEVACDAAFAPEVMDRAEALGIEARIVGRIEAQPDGRNSMRLEHCGEVVERSA